MEHPDVAFILGSPRSGTTVLGEILDLHTDIAQWYEPYFIWDRHFRNAPDDVRGRNDATPKVREYLTRKFRSYQQRRKTALVIDKSPRNSLKIPFILDIFPNAKFIHILRDGRDATLSIHREWKRRRSIVSDGRNKRFNYTAALRTMLRCLSRQSFLDDRLRAFWFETRGHVLNKSAHLNRLRWNGDVGWGPRFRGWEKAYRENSLLRFNAMQWSECVTSVLSYWDKIDTENRRTITYETLVTDPETVISGVLDFLNAKPDPSFFNAMPGMKSGNFNKWKTEFSREQLEDILPILSPALEETGYLDESSSDTPTQFPGCA